MLHYTSSIHCSVHASAVDHLHTYILWILNSRSNNITASKIIPRSQSSIISTCRVRRWHSSVVPHGRFDRARDRRRIVAGVATVRVIVAKVVLLLIKVAPSRVSLDVVAAVHLCDKSRSLSRREQRLLYSVPTAYQPRSRANTITRATAVWTQVLRLCPRPKNRGIERSVFCDRKNRKIGPFFLSLFLFQLLFLSPFLIRLFIYRLPVYYFFVYVERVIEYSSRGLSTQIASGGVRSSSCIPSGRPNVCNPVARGVIVVPDDVLLVHLVVIVVHDVSEPPGPVHCAHH